MNYNIRKFAALFVAVALCFSSCKNEEEDPKIIPDEEKEEAKPLLKVTVPSTWLGVDDDKTSYDGWVFVSDSKGQTLAVKNFANNEMIEFEKPPTFTEDKVFLNIVKIRKSINGSSGSNMYEVRSYPVNVSTEVNLLPSSVATPNLGNSTMTVTNTPAMTLDYIHPYVSFEGQKGTVSSYTSMTGSVKFGFSLRQTPVKALVSIKTGEEQPHKYKFIDKLETGKDYETDFNDLIPMENTIEFELPEGSFHVTSLDAYTVEGDNSTIYNLGMSMNKMAKLYYPKDAFKEFSTFSYYTTATSSHFYHKLGTPMTSFEPLAVSMNVTKKSLDGYEFTNTGTYDTYSVSFTSYKEVEDEQNSFNWYMYGEASNSVSGIVPTVPSEIVKEHPQMDRSVLVMSRIGFDEYPLVDGKQYFENLLQKASQDTKGYKTTSLSVANSGQRKAMSEEAAKKEFEEYVRAATY